MAEKTKYPVIRCTPKTGGEPVLCEGRKIACVQDYWRWAHSELNSNAERGKFAEYLVSLALDCAGGTSEEWGAYDILWEAERVKVEVKTSAYIQVWGQKALSIPSFSTRPSRAWNPEDNTYEEAVRRQADVYVFALENCTIQDMVNPNPLDLSQWEFYVLPTSKLDERGTQGSISLPQLAALGARKVIELEDLADAVREAATENAKHVQPSEGSL